MTDEKKPAFEQRLGSIRVTIWENQDKDGNTFFNTTIVRRYKSAEDDWTNSNSYTGLSDLALLGEAVEIAKAWQKNQAINHAKA